jgi:hypothetical protein
VMLIAWACAVAAGAAVPAMTAVSAVANRRKVPSSRRK